MRIIFSYIDLDYDYFDLSKFKTISWDFFSSIIVLFQTLHHSKRIIITGKEDLVNLKYTVI